MMSLMKSRRCIAPPKVSWISSQVIKAGNRVQRNGRACGNVRCENPKHFMSVRVRIGPPTISAARRL
jgi:hypothetical protein